MAMRNVSRDRDARRESSLAREYRPRQCIIIGCGSRFDPDIRSSNLWRYPMSLNRRRRGGIPEALREGVKSSKTKK